MPTQRLLGSRGNEKRHRLNRSQVLRQPGLWWLLKNTWTETPDPVQARPGKSRWMKMNEDLKTHPLETNRRMDPNPTVNPSPRFKMLKAARLKLKLKISRRD